MADLRKEKYDFTVGKPLGKLVRFALPVVAVYILQSLYNTADTIVAGRYISEDALSAVGASGQVTGLVLTLISGATLGMSVVVAQYFGAKDMERLRRSITTSLYIILVLSAVFSVVGAVLARPILRLMQTPDEILEDAAVYLRIIFLGSTATALYNMANSISRSLGDSMTPMIVLIVTAVLNVGLNVLFVVVFHMGVPGVAYATIIATALAALTCAAILARKMPFILPVRHMGTWDRDIAKSVVKIGIPSALQSSSLSLGNVMVQGIVNSCGKTFIAAFTSATKVDNFISWPPGGFTSAMQYYTGQNIGAGKPERIRHGVKVSLLVVVIYSSIMAAVTIPLAPAFMRLFTTAEGEMVHIGARYLQIVAPFWSFAGINHMFKSILTGAGDAVSAIFVSLAEMFCKLVLSFVFSRFWGFTGVIIAAPIGWFASAAMGFVIYRRGKWKNKSIVQ